MKTQKRQSKFNFVASLKFLIFLFVLVFGLPVSLDVKKFDWSRRAVQDMVDGLLCDDVFQLTGF